MFDVFQNVLFGKKKSNAEAERERATEADEFVMVGNNSNNDQPSVRESDPNSTDLLFPRNPYSPKMQNDILTTAPAKSEETYCQIMPLQDVPFIINSSLSASAKLDQIWLNMSSILNSIAQYKPYREEYDFSLEKSVISETMNK